MPQTSRKKILARALRHRHAEKIIVIAEFPNGKCPQTPPPGGRDSFLARPKKINPCAGAPAPVWTLLPAPPPPLSATRAGRAAATPEWAPERPHTHADAGASARGKLRELRKLLAFAEKLCGGENERRALSRVRMRTAWWSIVFAKAGYWSGRE